MPKGITSAFLSILSVLVCHSGVYAATGKPVGYIDTPDACLVATSISATEIHLSAAGKCEGKPGRAYVELSPGEERVLIVDGTNAGKRTVSPLGVVDLSSALEKGEKAAAAMILPDNRHSGSMERAARSTSDVYYSDEFQNKVKKVSDRLMDTMLGQAASYYQDSDIPDVTPGRTLLGADERLYLFISSSMPISVLRKYVADIARLNDPRVIVVLRGFKEGMAEIKPTLQFFSEVLKKDSLCVVSPETPCVMNQVNLIVDPLLFRKYQVTQVPSFVYVEGLHLDNPEMSEGVDLHISKQGQSFIIAGDVKLGYAATRLASESQSKVLEYAGRLLH